MLIVAFLGVGYTRQALQSSSLLSVEAAMAIQVRKALEQARQRPPLFTLYLKNQAGALADYFGRLGYRLRAVMSGGEPVPRVYVSALPADFNAIDSIEQRKRLFIRIVLPLVLKENERLSGVRNRLKRLHAVSAGGGTPAKADQAWLAWMYQRYKVDAGDFETLLRRVDVVPPSLAVAQAITESGWGTSRFALEGNALFGQWTWSRSAPGLVPLQRAEDKHHRVRAFDSLEQAVRAYMYVLNTSWAYRDLRLARAYLRRAGRPLDGLRLAQNVRKYSEDRQLYVNNLRSVMRTNELRKLDGARLSTTGAVVSAPPHRSLIDSLGKNLLAYRDGR